MTAAVANGRKAHSQTPDAGNASAMAERVCRASLVELGGFEATQTLEKCLWPAFISAADCPDSLVVALALLVGCKFRTGTDPWVALTNYPDSFRDFFRRVLVIAAAPTTSWTVRCALAVFLDAAVQTIDNAHIRKLVAPL
ncbi:hypothetical protein NEOLI_003490, partial [Neolecta irregularis DAH-3]